MIKCHPIEMRKEGTIVHLSQNYKILSFEWDFDKRSFAIYTQESGKSSFYPKRFRLYLANDEPTKGASYVGTASVISNIYSEHEGSVTQVGDVFHCFEERA